MLYHTQWESKGTRFGDCFTGPDTEFMYVHIPKNASSWTRQKVTELGWSLNNYHQYDLKNKHAIVVLRDPLERWTSGIVEYFYRYHKNISVDQINNTIFDLMADIVTVDPHTEQQVYYIEGLDHKHSTFFYCDQNYSYEINHFLNQHGYSVNYKNSELVYTTKNNAVKQSLHQVFSKMLDDSKYVKYLKGKFHRDYKLLDQITFYKSS